MKHSGLFVILSMGVAAASVLGVTGFVRHAGGPLWCESLAAFLAAKLAGDAVGVLRRTAQTFFYEDFLKEAAIYISGGILSVAAIVLAERFIGGSVRPAFPALGMHAVFLLTRAASGKPL
ncbi:MAG: hypothetical protein AB1576_03045 [Bacillota bacterium]